MTTHKNYPQHGLTTHAPSEVVCLSFVRVSIHSSNGGRKIVLREAGGRRCAGCGHARPQQFDGINLSKTDTTDADYITDTHGVLVACAARGAPEWPSEPPPAAHTPGIAFHMLVPLAMASADHFFGRPQPASGARRDDGELVAVCVTTTMGPASTQEARTRVLSLGFS